MANITELTEVTAVADTDVLYCVQGSNDRNMTVEQLKSHFHGAPLVILDSRAIADGNDVNSVLFDFNPSANGDINSTYTDYNGLKIDLEYSDSNNASKLTCNGISNEFIIKANANILGVNGILTYCRQEDGSNSAMYLYGNTSTVYCNSSNSNYVGGINAETYSYLNESKNYTINSMYGAWCRSDIEAASANSSIIVTDSYGVWAQSFSTASNASNCSVSTTNNYGIVSQTLCNQSGLGTATFTNNYGVCVKNGFSGSPSTGTITNHYGLYLESFPVATNEWGVYVAGAAAKNYCNGPVTIGTTAASAKVHVVSTTEQLRLGYDGSNYASFTVSSAGVLTLTTSANKIALGASRTPSAANAAGTAGEMCWDTNYLYVCVSTNTWKRALLETWT